MSLPDELSHSFGEHTTAKLHHGVSIRRRFQNYVAGYGTNGRPSRSSGRAVPKLFEGVNDSALKHSRNLMVPPRSSRRIKPRRPISRERCEHCVRWPESMQRPVR